MLASPDASCSALRSSTAAPRRSPEVYLKALVVGAGGATRELLRRLGEVWQVTVIDLRAESLERTAREQRVSIMAGDGSSRTVLRRAGLEGADALVAATNDDEVNLEACRLAREAGVLRVAAVAADPARLEAYRQLGVPAFSPDILAARQLELQLESRRMTSTAFAGGRAEAIEFQITPDSPVRGQALRQLRAGSWLVAAVLRQDQLLIPHGDTVLEAGDQVTVVGAAVDFSAIVRTFTSGEPQFPLDFGKRVAVAVDGKELTPVFAEAMQLVRNSRATSALLVYRDPATLAEVPGSDAIAEAASRAANGVELHLRPVAERPSGALARVPREESVGVLAVPAPEPGPMSGLKIRRLMSLARSARVAVLVCRGSCPYRRILVPAHNTAAGRGAARAAIDLARSSNATLIGLAVVDPAFVAGEGAADAAQQDLGWLLEEASVQGVEVERRSDRGNPVRAFLQAEEESQADLVVLGISPRPRRFEMRIADHLAGRSTRSVLIVPSQE